MTAIARTGPKQKLVVLISGSGSNLQAILDACAHEEIHAAVVAVISNKADAYGLVRAQNAGIKTYVMPKRPSRAVFDAELADLVKGHQPDYVVLAGWMRLLSLSFLKHFPQQVINLHPALPGQYPGVGAVAKAHDAFQRGEIDHTGVMVHLVPDEGMDDGPLLAAAEVSLIPDEPLETLMMRVHQVEHLLLVRVLQAVCDDGVEPLMKAPRVYHLTAGHTLT